MARKIPWLWIGLGGVALGGIAMALGAAEEPERDPGEEPGAGFLDPIAVGQPDDPEIAALLTEMRDEFVSGGVDLSVITPEEVTVMPKAPGRPLAIPPRVYWPRMVRTIVEVFQPIRRAIGEPIPTRAYRPPDYNKAVTCEREVGGECVEWSEGSRHQAFEALDMLPPPGMGREMAIMAAQIYVTDGPRLRMGFGVYPKSGRVHVDTGFRQRTWGTADDYVDTVKEAMA